MGHFEDALTVLDLAGEQLRDIKSEYDKSLQDKEVKTRLLGTIKNFMENLRSALDYSAHGLFAKYGSSPRPDPKIYFPTQRKTTPVRTFRSRLKPAFRG
jgi:hypothetical protein